MNTSKLQKPFVVFSTLIVTALTTVAADYHLAMEASVAALDTGNTTKSVVAPQLGFYISADNDDSHRLGIAYTYISFSNRIEWISDEPPFPDRVDAIIDNGSITIHQFKLAYRMNIAKVSDGIRIFITPAFGLGRISESGIHTVVGGITGGFSEPFNESKWKFNASGNIGFEWDFKNNWQFALSGGYLYQEAHDAMLFSKLNGLQGTTSFTYSF